MSYLIFEYIEANELAKLSELLTSKINLNATNLDGDVPLIAAVRLGNAEAVKILLKHGAKIEVRDPWGDTSLEIARNNGFGDIVKLLSGGEVEDGLSNQDVKPLQEASVTPKSDREMMLDKVKQNGKALYYASDELKSDKEVVLSAVSQDGNALEYVTFELVSDREVVLLAVMQDGSALQFASGELKSDKEIVLAAVRQNKDALKYASSNLKSDPDILMICN